MTRHQHAILRLLANGHTAEGIAEQLRVTEQNIWGQLRAMRREHGAHNAPHLVAIGFQRGWLTPETVAAGLR